MKKFKSFLILVIVVFFSSTAMAGSWTVMVGDTLSGIAKKSGNSLTAVMLANPQLKNFNHILIGQSICLPENGVQAVRQIAKKTPVSIDGMIWRQVGADPYRGTAKWAIEKFDIPTSIKETTLKNFSNNNFEWVNVESGQLLGAVTFGKSKIKKSVRTQWDGKKYLAKNFGAGDYVVAKVIWCNNLIWWKKGEVIPPPIQKEQLLEVQEEPMLAVRELQEASVIPCKKCQDQGEFDSGAYWIVHDPGGHSENKGWGAFGEILFWRNFAEDCSSEYAWGVGALASAYGYTITNKPESGDGSRLTAQVGIKRNWTGGDELLSRQFIVKGRLGMENSHWENSDRDWHIDQVGPVAGVYAEYRHEVIYDQLWLYATVESWFGFGNQKVDSSFVDIKSANRTFVEAVVGVDYKFAPNWVWRNYAGLDYQGYDDLIPGVVGTEIRHELADDWGTISAGFQGKFYATINPTALLYVKWEITTPLQRWYENSRQESVQLVGTGIGGNQFLSTTTTTTTENPPVSTDRMEEVFASLSSNK
jgi:LysM repeat protein